MMFIFLFAGLADLATTAVGLSFGISEANPFLAGYGLVGFLLAKSAAMAGVVAILLLRGQAYPKLWLAARYGSVLWLIAAASNLGVLL